MQPNQLNRIDFNGRKLRSGLFIASITMFLFTSFTVHAEVEFDWNGFGTIGIGILDDDSINEQNAFPHNGYSESVEADIDSRLGVQGDVYFNDTISATVQIVSDSSATDAIEIEWAYISYNVTDSLKIRAGRFRRPLYAKSDYLPVGYAYTWARPPQEVYSNDVKIYDGIEALDFLYQDSIGDWDLIAELYYGQTDGTSQFGHGQEGDYETHNDYGITVTMERNGLSFRYGYHRSPDITVDTSSQLQELFDGLNAAGFSSLVDELKIDGITAEFYNLGVGLDYRDWTFAAEYVLLPTEGGLAPDESSWHLSAAKRIDDWTFHATYGDRHRRMDDDFAQSIYTQANAIGAPFNAGLLQLADGLDQAEQAQNINIHSYAIGMRYDFSRPISIKAEYQHIVDDQFNLTNNLLSVVVDFLF